VPDHGKAPDDLAMAASDQELSDDRAAAGWTASANRSSVVTNCSRLTNGHNASKFGSVTLAVTQSDSELTAAY